VFIPGYLEISITYETFTVKQSIVHCLYKKVFTVEMSFVGFSKFTKLFEEGKK
jgi:hypothetical protein